MILDFDYVSAYLIYTWSYIIIILIQTYWINGLINWLKIIIGIVDKNVQIRKEVLKRKDNVKKTHI